MKHSKSIMILLTISIFILNLESREPRKLSPIPLPETKILKKDTILCDDSCLDQLLINGQIFSFLANSDGEIENLWIKERKLILEASLNIKNSNEENVIKIALLLPETIIGRYSSSITKSIFSFLLAKDAKFVLKSYFIEDENNSSISTAIENITSDGFRFVIAPMTIDGAKIISELSPKLYFFFPTIHSENIFKRNEFLYFGGINYHSQIEKLLQYFDGEKVALFYDDSTKGEELNNIVLDELNRTFPNMDLTTNEKVSKTSTDFSKLFKDNNSTVGQSYFINTTKVKSSIILAQLTTYDQEPKLILSTQINYTPILLSMTQPNDRKNMLIANSISKVEDETITDINLLLSNDINYDWINYSSTVGADYFYFLLSGKPRVYDEQVIDNQIIYNIRIMKPLEAKFIDVERNL